LSHIAIAAGALILIAIPVGLDFIDVLVSADSGSNGSEDPYCTPIYLFDISTAPSSLLDIDAPFGTLSFSTAKLIDLAWDIGFSRCGQALLAWITYRVNTSALLRIMETQPVSYELFSTLSLSWSSVASLRPVVNAVFKKLGFRKKLILIWIVLSISWVAFWPTITNAMTGYVAKSNTLVQLQGGDGYANFSDIATVSNLAFQIDSYSGNFKGPILLSTGPNTTLWASLNQGEKCILYDIFHKLTKMN
jgi:hypothetical protein